MIAKEEVKMKGLICFLCSALFCVQIYASEFAKKGITVNSVSPGLIDDVVKETSGTWIGRTGTGADIARAIVYLASDNSSS